MIKPEDLPDMAREKLTAVFGPGGFDEDMVAKQVEVWAPMNPPPGGPLEPEFYTSWELLGMASPPGDDVPRPAGIIPICQAVVEFGPACCWADALSQPPAITLKSGVTAYLN